MKKKDIFVLSLLILLIPFTYSSEKLINSQKFEGSNPVLVPINAIEDFVIDDDGQFQLWAVSGDGSEFDPWIIRDLVVYDPPADIGIWIHDTTDYFQIINCTVTANRYDICIEDVATDTATVKNCTVDQGATGIGIINSAGAYVRDCIAYDCASAGYEADNATDILFMYNKAYTCDRGFEILESYSADLFWCEAYDAGYDSGFYARNSEDIAIQNCIVERSIYDGIQINNCTSAYVGLNNCTDNGYHGLEVVDSEYSLIEKNRFYDCDLGVSADSVEDLLTYDVYLDNTLNDEEIYYGENDNMVDLPGWIQQYPQIILVNATDVNILAQDVLAHYIYLPIQLRYGQDITIQGCFFENSIGGISASDIDNLKVIDCSFLDTGVPIGLVRTTNSLIQYNSIELAIYAGVALNDNADNNIIRNNTFEDIGWYGVSITDSQYNYIYHNNFINCSSLFSSYGNDAGTNNYWYNPTLQEGNWWDNWVSGPYAIEGSAGSFDLYPLGGIIVIPEFNHIGLLVSIISLISFISLVMIYRRR